jgi:hypothetical protein
MGYMFLNWVLIIRYLQNVVRYDYNNHMLVKNISSLVFL